MVANTNGVKTPTKPASKANATAADVKRAHAAPMSAPKQRYAPEPSPEPIAPLPAFAEALQKLHDLISTSHRAVSELTQTLQPFLQTHVFDDGATADAGDTDRSTYGSSLSPTLSSVYASLNELDRLIIRLDYVQRNVVL